MTTIINILSDSYDVEPDPQVVELALIALEPYEAGERGERGRPELPAPLLPLHLECLMGWLDAPVVAFVLNPKTDPGIRSWPQASSGGRDDVPGIQCTVFSSCIWVIRVAEFPKNVVEAITANHTRLRMALT